MPIKNYTTKVPANRSIQQIQDALVAHGAVGIVLGYEKDTGRIENLQFVLDLEGTNVSFRLPVEWRKFQAVLKEQNVKRWDDDDFCYRVAWRNIRDLVLANLAFYETRMASMPQLLLSYAVTDTGQTLFEKVASNTQFLLGSGE